MSYRVVNREAKPSSFRPGKTRPASLLNSFKKIPQKACPSGVQTKDENVIIKKKKLFVISTTQITNWNEEFKAHAWT